MLDIEYQLLSNMKYLLRSEEILFPFIILYVCIPLCLHVTDKPRNEGKSKCALQRKLNNHGCVIYSDCL